MKKLLGLIGLTIIGAVFGLYLFRNAKQPERAKPPKVETVTIKGLKKELKSKSEIRKSEYVDWIAKDGNNIPLQSEQFVLLSKDYGIKDNDISKIDGKFLDPIAKKVTKYYEAKGFRLNEQNTNLVPNDLWFISLGFEKDGVYCVNNFTKNSDPFAYLSCGTKDLKQIEMQAELGEVYEESMTKIGNSVPAVFRVDKIKDNFAMGSVSGLGGWTWIAKKSDGKWRVVWTGQDIATCSSMEKYDIPKAIYGSCYDEVTKKER